MLVKLLYSLVGVCGDNLSYLGEVVVRFKW